MVCVHSFVGKPGYIKEVMAAKEMHYTS
jgi:hypothetical protein